MAGRERGDWPWAALIVGYFLFQTLWRRLLGGGFGIDEAQMFLWGREPPALGYGPQPPLYAWIQWAAFRLVPDPLLALSLVKNALLAGTYLAVMALMRTAYPRPVAGLAAACLMLMPQIAWDSQREMTHSVLVLLLAALAVVVFWERALPGRRGGWLGFGLLLGLGMLAKANFLVLVAALIAAALSMEELRRRLAPAGIGVSAVAAALIVAGPFWWAVVHRDQALASVGELHAEAGWAVAAGLGAVAAAVFGCFALAAAVLGLLLASWRAGEGPPAGSLDRLLGRTVLIGIALAAAGVVVTGTTHVRDIWILPVVFLGTPLAAARAQGRLGPRGAAVLRWTIVGLGVLVTVALTVHMRYGDPGHPNIRRAPVGAVAEKLAAHFPEATRFVAEPDWLAGNLIYARPDLPVVAARRPGPPPAVGERVVLVWWERDEPAWRRLLALLEARWGAPPSVGAPVAFEAPFPPQPRETFRIDAAPMTIAGAVK